MECKLTWKEIELLLKGTHKDFDQVMKGKGIIPDREISTLREGDLILRNMKAGCSPSYHAGIYCGNEEVISFTAPSGTKRWFLPQQSATVIKESVTNFLNGKSYEVFRLKSGIPGDFSNSVKKWMKYNEEYNLQTNNSLHFALRLLELPAEPLPERKSQSDGESTRASGSQIQTLQHQEPQVQFVANSEESGSVTLPSSSHEPNSPESTDDDDVKQPPVKNV